MFSKSENARPFSGTWGRGFRDWGFEVQVFGVKNSGYGGTN